MSVKLQVSLRLTSRSLIASVELMAPISSLFARTDPSHKLSFRWTAKRYQRS